MIWRSGIVVEDECGVVEDKRGVVAKERELRGEASAERVKAGEWQSK